MSNTRSNAAAVEPRCGASPDRSADRPEDAAVQANCGRIETFDVSAQQELVKPWDVRLNQVAAGGFHGEVHYVTTPGMMIYEERWRQPMEVSGASPQGFFMLGTSIATHGASVDWCGKPIDRRRLACSPSGGAVDFATPPESDHVVLLVRPALLFSALGSDAADSIYGRRHLDVPTSSGARLIECITRAVRQNAAQPRRLADHEASSLESRILEALNDCVVDVDRSFDSEPSSVRRAAVRRAIEFVDEFVGPITTLELAAKVGVCQRTLEYGFREVLGLTPPRYLRLHRINGAFRDLCSADPRSSNVTQVALAWGFGHPGRFSVAYRKHFGETPSTTLTRSSRRPALRLLDLIR